MKRRLRGVGGVAGLVAVGVVLAGLLLMLSACGRAQVAQQPYPSPQPLTPGAYPVPLTPTPEQPPADLPPTPTLHPRTTIFPTVPPPGPTLTPFSPPPTPVVTVIPTAEPPIIPVPPGQAESYTIVFRDGNVIRAIESDSTNERVLVDIRAHVPLFLADERVGVKTWGSPSPDGDQLALVLSNVEELSRKGEVPEYDIYLFDLATGLLRPLVQDGVEPVWSPDGTRIAYRGLTSGLWIVDVATGETREVYAVDRENEHFATNFDWSPDGKRLVFLDKVFRGSAAIMIIEADEAEATTALVSSTTQPPNLPQWSPNGNRILFVSLFGESSGPLDSYNLWSMNPDGTNQTQLTHDLSVSSGQPRWSPDGRWIVFAGTQYYEEPEPLTDLWLVDSGGVDLKRLTSNAAKATNELSPAWSPDGAQVVFAREVGDIWTISLVDGTQTRLTSATSDFILLR